MEQPLQVKVPDTVFIRTGYSANAEIVLARASDVPTIPESSIEFGNDSAFVYKIKEEKPKQVFEKKHVKIGISDGVKIEIKNGLTATDQIRGNKIDDKAKDRDKNKK